MSNLLLSNPLLFVSNGITVAKFVIAIALSLLFWNILWIAIQKMSRKNSDDGALNAAVLIIDNAPKKAKKTKTNKQTFKLICHKSKKLCFFLF